MASKGSPTREKGRRAGASAPPTPKHRLEMPLTLKNRMEKAVLAKGRKTNYYKRKP
jgi:hypothetical protein